MNDRSKFKNFFVKVFGRMSILIYLRDKLL